MKKLLFAFVMILTCSMGYAQDVDEILNTSIEVTGGAEAWAAIENVQISGVFNQGGMEFPFVQTQTKDGKSKLEFEFQGVKLSQNVFDGEVLWGSNMMTMEAEKNDDEALTNFKNNSAKDFPVSYMNYADKGYSVELIGEEEVDGVTCHKVKLTKIPLIMGGEEKPNFEFLFFDQESGVHIASESVDPSGQVPGDGIIKLTMSDFIDVDGLYFPSSMTASVQGNPMYSMTFDKIETNVDLDESIFEFPATETKEEGEDE